MMFYLEGARDRISQVAAHGAPEIVPQLHAWAERRDVKDMVVVIPGIVFLDLCPLHEAVIRGFEGRQPAVCALMEMEAKGFIGVTEKQMAFDIGNDLDILDIAPPAVGIADDQPA